MREPGRYDALRDAEQKAATERQEAVRAEFRETGEVVTDRTAAVSESQVTTEKQGAPQQESAPKREAWMGYEDALAQEARILDATRERRSKGDDAGDVKDFVRRENEKFEREQAKLDRLMGNMTREMDYDQDREAGDDRER